MSDSANFQVDSDHGSNNVMKKKFSYHTLKQYTDMREADPGWEF